MNDNREIFEVPVVYANPRWQTLTLASADVNLSTTVQPSWSEGGTTRHNFGRGPSNDYFIKVLFQLSNWFQTRRFLGWSSSKIVSGSCVLPPRWPPQCSCVVIESSFDPGERLQAPGSLWFICIFIYIEDNFYNCMHVNHPMTIPSKFGSNCATGSRQDGFYVNFP
jgi:hypothetical protein